MLTLSVAFKSAPFASSDPTISKLPPNEAKWSGTPPFCGTGEHHGQHLLPPSSRGPSACVHQHTRRVSPSGPAPACILSPAFH
jgi:hypothetical protein